MKTVRGLKMVNILATAKEPTNAIRACNDRFGLRSILLGSTRTSHQPHGDGTVPCFLADCFVIVAVPSN